SGRDSHSGCAKEPTATLIDVIRDIERMHLEPLPLRADQPNVNEKTSSTSTPLPKHSPSTWNRPTQGARVVTSWSSHSLPSGSDEARPDERTLYASPRDPACALG